MSDTDPIIHYTALQVVSDKWWIGLLAFGVGLVATPIARTLAYRWKVVDRPDDLLKPHGRPVAYMGGLGMLAGLLAGLIAYLVSMPDLATNWANLVGDLKSFSIQSVMANPVWHLFAVILSSILITIVGLLDDVYNLRPRQKIYGQMIAAGILLVGGVADNMSSIFLTDLMGLMPFSPPYWLILSTSTLLTLIIVVGACNATNLLDGLDGLCGGVTAIITLGFLALAVWLAMYMTWGIPSDHFLRVALCFAMVGGVLGFLPYNLPPASIFMGDAGSMLLGFFVAMMMVLFCDEATARWFLASIVVFSLPILDTGLAVIRRLLAGQNIFQGDRGHLYDQLVDRGMTVKQVVTLFYVLSALAGAAGVALSIWLRIREALPIFLFLLIGSFVTFYLLGMMTPPKGHGKSPGTK